VDGQRYLVESLNQTHQSTNLELLPCDKGVGPRIDFAMDAFAESHSRAVLLQWDSFVEKISLGAEETVIDGRSLDIATTVAVARWVMHAKPRGVRILTTP